MSSVKHRIGENDADDTIIILAPSKGDHLTPWELLAHGGHLCNTILFVEQIKWWLVPLSSFVYCLEFCRHRQTLSGKSVSNPI